MTNENFIEGVKIIYSTMPEKAKKSEQIASGEGEIYFGFSHYITDSHDIKILEKLGWFVKWGYWCCCV